MVLPPQRMPARRNHRNLVTSRLGLGTMPMLDRNQTSHSKVSPRSPRPRRDTRSTPTQPSNHLSIS
jgi:hypothetical protein